MIWGAQWICGCGTHNLEFRGKCRECKLPKAINVGTETVADVMNNVTNKKDTK